MSGQLSGCPLFVYAEKRGKTFFFSIRKICSILFLRLYNAEHFGRKVYDLRACLPESGS